MLAVITPDSQFQPFAGDRAVVDLMLSDERFVHEMFEEIVTAEWPPTPDAPVKNPPSAPGTTSGAGPPGLPPSSIDSARQPRLHRPGTDGWARERSPPTRRAGQPSPAHRQLTEVMP